MICNCYLGKLGVRLFLQLSEFFRKTKIPETYKLMRETNEKIISKRSYKYSIVDNYASDEPSSEEYLTPNLTKKYQTLAGESIYFTSLEMYRMKQIFEPSIKLLGFKPASVLSPNVHIRAPLFCYPDESRVINSTTLFRALWQKCLDKEKVAFAILTQRKRSFPRLVALVPQRAESDADGALERFNGFRIEFIPFVGL